MPTVESRPNSSNDGRSVFLISKTGRFEPIYIDFKTLFFLVREFAHVEELKRGARLVKESPHFEGAKRIGRLVAYAAGRRFTWEDVCVKLNIPPKGR